MRSQLPAPLKNKKRRKAEVSGGAPPVVSTAEKREIEGKQRCPAVRLQLSAPLKSGKKGETEVRCNILPVASTPERQEK